LTETLIKKEEGKTLCYNYIVSMNIGKDIFINGLFSTVCYLCLLFHLAKIKD